MTVEEDLCLIKLCDRLVAEASQPDAAPNLQFRLKLLQHSAVMQSASETEVGQRQLGKFGRVDKADFSKTLQYWQDLYKATEPDTVWQQQEDTYNVTKDSRSRPPPPKQATLWY